VASLVVSTLNKPPSVVSPAIPLRLGSGKRPFLVACNAAISTEARTDGGVGLVLAFNSSGIHWPYRQIVTGDVQDTILK